MLLHSRNMPLTHMENFLEAFEPEVPHKMASDGKNSQIELKNPPKKLKNSFFDYFLILSLT